MGTKTVVIETCDVCGSSDDVRHYEQLQVILQPARMFTIIYNNVICQGCEDHMMDGHTLFWDGKMSKEESKLWFNVSRAKITRV